MTKSNVFAVKAVGAGALAVLLTASAFAEERPQDRSWRSGEQRSERGARDDRGRNSEGRDNRNRNDIERRDVRGGNDSYRGEQRRDARGSNDGYRGDQRRDARGGSQSYRNYRNNERVQFGGRISRFAHERGGYRVWLDGGAYPVWVPESHWRNDWRIGININIGGIFRDGVIYSDVYDDPYYGGGGYYNDGYRDGYLSGYVDNVDYRTDTLWLRDDRSGRVIAVDLRGVDRRYSRLDSRDLRRGDRVTFTGEWLRGGVFGADRIDAIDTRY